MRYKRALMALMATTIVAYGHGSVSSDEFPSRNLTFVAPFAAGSATDGTARYFADKLSAELGRRVLVENIPGANGILGIKDFLKRPADGYNVLIGSSTTHAANSSLYKALPYDPVKDFAPVACLTRVPLVLAIRSSLPFRTVAELIAHARQRPGELTYGWANSSSKAGVELVKASAKVDIRSVPYRGVPQVATDMLGGHVDMFVADPVTVIPHLASGGMRALAVTSATRAASLPDVPTMQEEGMPNYEIIGWFAAFLPTGAPPEVVDKLSNAFQRIVTSAEFKAYGATTSTEPFACSPAQLTQLVADDTRRWSVMVDIAAIDKQ